MSLIVELKRRNVFKVAVAYVIVGWVVLQVAETIAPIMNLPETLSQYILFFLIVGFPITIFFSWVYELTPDGLKKQKDIDRGVSITVDTGRKIDFIIIGALVLTIGGMVYQSNFVGNQIDPIEQPQNLKKTVAVLPFVNMSSDKEQEWFSDGLTEEILNSLAMLPELQVTARTSSFHFKGQNIPVPEIAKKLGVVYVVEGSVRRGGDILRITAQLILAVDGSHLWSDTYDKPISDVLDVQRDVAESIAQALNVVLDDKRREEMFASGTRNVQAFEAFHKGNAYSTMVHNRSIDKSLWDANEYFAQAIAEDPNFPAPHLNIQDAYSHFLLEGPNSRFLKNKGPKELDNAQALKKYQYHLQMAIDLAKNPKNKLEAEISQIFISDDWGGLQRILQELRENPSAIDININNTWLSDILHGLGEGDIILSQLESAIVLSPYDRLSWAYLINHLILSSNFIDAKKIIEQSKQYGFYDEDLLFSLYYFSKNNEKLEELYQQKIQKGEPVDIILHAMTGRKKEVERLLLQVNDAQMNNANEGFDWLFHFLGEQEKANALVLQMDSEPLGALKLAQMLSIFGKIYVAKEYAPNYVRKLRQAGLSEEKIQSMFLPSK